MASPVRDKDLLSIQQARALAVHSAGIAEALKKIYGAEKVLAELGIK